MMSGEGRANLSGTVKPQKLLNASNLGLKLSGDFYRAVFVGNASMPRPLFSRYN